MGVVVGDNIVVCWRKLIEFFFSFVRSTEFSRRWQDKNKKEEE